MQARKTYDCPLNATEKGVIRVRPVDFVMNQCQISLRIFPIFTSLSTMTLERACPRKHVLLLRTKVILLKYHIIEFSDYRFGYYLRGLSSFARAPHLHMCQVANMWTCVIGTAFIGEDLPPDPESPLPP